MIPRQHNTDAVLELYIPITGNMQRFCNLQVAHKAIKEEVQHQEELLNLHKGLTEQLSDAVALQSKQW